LTEIAAICALESGARIVATVDQSAKTDSFVGLPLVKTFDDLWPAPGLDDTDLSEPGHALELHRA